ncbi:MAG: ATP-dependent helicase [Clostridiaceae bacterium]|jgi:DNA helicase-2/ATP-dependent DNA helicase PcrA|nr:ATP-dependent helicase [Clostridiaceae bacterium]
MVMKHKGMLNMTDNLLNNEIEKEIQFTLEKEKLEQVLKLINEETLGYIDKRKKVAQYIMDYRQKALEEYKDDEDKIIEYFDHERYVKEESFNFIDRKLKELTILKSNPYFGKVNFKESDDIPESIYIGRFGLTLEDDLEPIVVDWRAPVSSLFYAGKLGEAKYEAPDKSIFVYILSKRQFIIKRGILQGIFDTALDVKDEILQQILSKNSEEKLKDIIMTIQQEQDDIIRQPKNKMVVVNGVAGSGKTTIALHRTAYLLYNYRKSLQDKVLIFGPNNIFMEYISTVLPSLGEEGVKQTTFNNFAMEAMEVNDIMNFKDYMEKILNNEKNFINEIIYKNSDEYIKELDNLICQLNEGYFKFKDVVFMDTTVVNESELKDMFNKYFKYMPLFRRNKKVKRIVFSKLRDIRNDKFKEINQEYDNEVSKLSKDELQLYQNDLEFKRRLKIRGLIQNLIDAKKKLTWLNNQDIISIYSEFNHNKGLIQDDLAPILYLKIKLEGYKIAEEIRHVVIDEAQDYSLLQFIVINELTRCNSLTIVGDSNQRLIPLKGITPMLKLKEVFKDTSVENFDLLKSYRSTKEIMEYANKHIKTDDIVPLVRSGEKVEEITLSEDNMIEIVHSKLRELKENGYENIAVICKNMDITKSVASKLKSTFYIKLIDNENCIYEGGEIIIPSYLSKGLEFDAVILLDDMKNDCQEDKLKYVMCTRALHKLIVLRGSFA